MKKVAILGFLMAACLGLFVLAILGRLHTPRSAVEPNAVDVADGETPSSFPNTRLQYALGEPARALHPTIEKKNVRSLGSEDKGIPQLAKTFDDLVKDLDNAFASDSPSNARSAKTTAGIVTAFASPRAEGSHLNAVDCRATRCRLDIDFVDLEAHNRVLQDIFGLLLSSGVDNAQDLGFYVTSSDDQPDGKKRVIIQLFPAERVPKP